MRFRTRFMTPAIVGTLSSPLVAVLRTVGCYVPAFCNQLIEGIDG